MVLVSKKSCLNTAFDDAVSDGITGEAGNIMNIKFFHQGLPVLFDSLDADFENVCGHFVGITLCDELKNLHFPRREELGIRSCNARPVQSQMSGRIQPLGNGKTEIGFSAVDFADGLGQNAKSGSTTRRQPSA